MNIVRFTIVAAVLAAALTMPLHAAIPGVTVKDTFGRTVNSTGLNLVDLDGYLANPAIKFTVTVPTAAALPATAVLTANHQRLYFNSACSVGLTGPSKTIQFTSTTQEVAVYESIFPDRDGVDENYTLTIRLSDKNGSQSVTTVPIHVIDQDANSAPTFRVSVDFSTDQTGFFEDTQKRAVIQQAADDWAYFIDGTGFKQVALNTERTWIWGPGGWETGPSFNTYNSFAYTGFLLYAYGIHTTGLRSGGEGSGGGGYQYIGTTKLPLRRSGGLEVETQGNYNTSGWYVSTADDDWWTCTNAGGATDLYSIVHHEIGHTLAFSSAYPQSAAAQAAGAFDSPAIQSYMGSAMGMDSSYHFAGIVDPSSKRGIFGAEYSGTVPGRRWLLNKADLLALQVAGYTLRDPSALAPVSLTQRSLSAGAVGTAYSEQLWASGGTPVYAWDITAGALPSGFSLDSFTGLISGAPTTPGSYAFTVRVRDNGPAGASATADFTINVPDTSAPTISSVTVSPALAAGGDPLQVSVTTADNVGVTSVTADGAALSNSGSAWQGTIPASTAVGDHTVTVVARDAANNPATDTTAGYRTGQIVGIANAGAQSALATAAPQRFLFVVWGKVISADALGFVLDDGSGCPIAVTAPGHLFKTGDYVRARGILSPGDEHPSIATTPGTAAPVD